ncbi:hypothetical protein H2O64_13955 [Kordia sp. YSTF-M3]|uniref:Uncharacterized protein n=1 Tax=Kordia aestuariivivens TaxID=2759037 RepID=A0ABR7QB18_9FLAO|nr:hypothetical protein [Kordia aestuariivivens]MBC8755776.1 hypothetical protein [Kordia aestuariivivens]
MKLKIDFQKIKELRERLSIPLDLAKELIIENDGDLLTCEQEFHRNNINTICRLTECDEITADKYYRICEFDIEKSIKKIHEQLSYLTINSNESIHKIGFILWAENESLDKYLTSRDKSLFIQTKDFEYVIEAFESVFPMKDLDDGSIQSSFSYTSNNFFDNKTSRIIVERMSKIKTKDPNVELFIRDLIKWFNIQLRYADDIIVYGNL